MKTDPQTSLFQWIRSGLRRRGALQGVTTDNSESASVLHAMLEDRVGVVDLVITDNRRRMVSVKKRRDRHEFRVHHMFLGCNTPIVEALVGLSKSDPASRLTIREFVAENRASIKSRNKPSELRVTGEVYDLQELLFQVIQTFDEAQELADIAITWGRKSSGARSIRLGSFEFEQRLVRIHPSLDAPWVPRYFVEFVIYHELLHALIPPQIKDGRRVVHSPEFRKRERAFLGYNDAILWEQKNLHRLLK